MLHNMFVAFPPLFIEVSEHFIEALYITYIQKELKKFLLSQGKSLSLEEFLEKAQYKP